MNYPFNIVFYCFVKKYSLDGVCIDPEIKLVLQYLQIQVNTEIVLKHNTFSDSLHSSHIYRAELQYMHVGNVPLQHLSLHLQ